MSATENQVRAASARAKTWAVGRLGCRGLRVLECSCFLTLTSVKVKQEPHRFSTGALSRPVRSFGSIPPRYSRGMGPTPVVFLGAARCERGLATSAAEWVGSQVGAADLPAKATRWPVSQSPGRGGLFRLSESELFARWLDWGASKASQRTRWLFCLTRLSRVQARNLAGFSRSASLTSEDSRSELRSGRYKVASVLRLQNEDWGKNGPDGDPGFNSRSPGSRRKIPRKKPCKYVALRRLTAKTVIRSSPVSRRSGRLANSPSVITL